ncbi:unnamed protein product [Brassica rapa]|uniref:SWIM-type domain-containing protein n=1 Tax=Brassica campestris TaxID=3711 RepID=A0A3P5YHQ2_BRACM|nr:unnamed protein product [Brassica rapa]VDC60950.1 unnamed protein product [Brassica rapa]
MTKNMATVKGSYINSVNEWTCQILGKFGRSDKVMLAERKCSCKYFDNIKIPCGHAILAANGLGDGSGVLHGVSTETLCGHWYKTYVWRETYAGVINPDQDPRNVDIPEEVSKMVVYPPITKRQPGRRRKSRIPSTGEIKVSKNDLLDRSCKTDRC